eukprot:m.265348 g.265348  ORF g.265348 m.265348 type:complete len:202 (+) comp11061_c0_seq8:444-1049(+)
MLLMTRFYAELHKLGGQRGAAPRALRAAQSWLQTLRHSDVLLPVEELTVRDLRAGAASVSVTPELAASMESSSEARSAMLRVATSVDFAGTDIAAVTAAEVGELAAAVSAGTAQPVSFASVSVADTDRQIVRAVLSLTGSRHIMVEGEYNGSVLVSARAGAVSAAAAQAQCRCGDGRAAAGQRRHSRPASMGQKAVTAKYA